MSQRPAVFVELCGGLAAVSLRLQGGAHARPPVSRIGNKHGYSHAILAALGLHAGQGADFYLWCEPDPGARLLLQAYARPEILAAAAAVIRGWSDRQPRELWESLRAEGPIVARRAADGGAAAEVARWLIVTRWAFSQNAGPNPGYGGPGSKAGHMSQESRDRALGCEATAARLASLPEFQAASVAADARDIDPREVARWAWIVGHGDRYSQDQPLPGHDLSPQYKPGAEDRATWKPPPRDWIARRLESLPTIPAAVAADARDIDPREVARWIALLSANRLINISGQTLRNTGAGGSTHGGAEFATDAETLAARLAAMPSIPAAAVAADARDIDPPAKLEGVYVFIDPPYEGTTGYGKGCELPRSEVVALARRWHEAGAVVAISEQCAITGWADQLWPIDITQTRKGQKRTFSKQKTEILTLNRPPAEKPAEQMSIFGGAQ